MVTVPEATEKIVRRSRYLSEALSKDIINVSSLARYIKPEIEGILFKKVSLSSVIMALKRLSGNIYPEIPYQEFFRTPPEMTLKTNLALLISHLRNLNNNEGKMETALTTKTPTGTIILGQKEALFPYVEADSKLYYPVSSIAILIPKEAINTPGIYYFFLKSLAWERINILHTFTSSSEFTIVVDDKDTQRTLGILKSLFEEIS